MKAKFTRIVTFPIILTILFSCQTPTNRYPYAIRDFSPIIQPYLTGIVTHGIVGSDTLSRYIYDQASDDVLKRLIVCEHPILRALGLRVIMERPGFDHFKILMTHLDDTATVTRDAGEWGIDYAMISDDVIRGFEWKTKELRDKTIEEVITKHSYLKSAYTILQTLQPNEKLYPYIITMAKQDRPYDEIECALYGLAKFKKERDADFIADILFKNAWRMSEVSFFLMERYPDTSYRRVFEKYFKKELYKKLHSDEYSHLGESFYSALAAQKDEKSAEMLNWMLEKKPFIACRVDSSYFKEQLMVAIWNNPCIAYQSIRKKIESRMREREKSIIGLPMEPSTQPETYYWNTNIYCDF